MKLILASLILLTIGCKKSSDLGPEEPPAKSGVLLTEAVTNSCFNVQKFHSQLSLLYPNPLIRQVTTDVRVNSDESIHYELKKILAFRNFEFTDRYRDAIPDIKLMEQQDCGTVTVKTVGGDFQIFKVIDSSESHIVFQNEMEESYKFEWLSPQHFKMTKKYRFVDLLCGSDAKIFVTVTKDFSWDPDFISAQILPKDFISDELIQMLSETSGYPIDSIYIQVPVEGRASEDNPDEVITERRVSKEALSTLAVQPVNTDWAFCTGRYLLGRQF